MKPLSSAVTPALSSARPSVLGRRPMETRTLSASIADVPVGLLHLHLAVLEAAGGLRLDQHLHAQAAELAHQHIDQIRVRAGQQLIHRFDDRHLGTELGVGLSQLHADHAAAHDHQVLRDLRERQGARGVDHILVIDGEELRVDGHRAGRDDRVLKP